MISLIPLLELGEDSCVHCQTKEDAAAFVSFLYENFPEKINQRFDMIAGWDTFEAHTVYYPNFFNCNKMCYGKLGSRASTKRRMFEFYELVAVQELPIEQSDMDINFIFGL